MTQNDEGAPAGRPRHTLESSRSERSEYRQAAVWVGALWGEREGYFNFAFGVGGNFTTGTYGFAHWRERPGRWPDDRDRFLAEALEKASEVDVYVTPYLRSNPSRKKGTALPSSWLYADFDAAPHGQLKTPSGVLLLGPGGLLVGSGQGRHVYPRLPDDLEPDALERLNRHLAYALGADAGWSETKVLRLPGTWNHKGRARGGESTPVELLDFRPAVRDWSPQDLCLLLPPGGAEGLGTTNGDQSIEPVLPEDVPAHLHARLDEEPEDRSVQTYAFVASCLDAGLSDAETLALALEHRPTNEKYGDRASDEIARAVRKLRKPSKRSRRSDSVDSDRDFLGAVEANGVGESVLRDSPTPDAAPLVDVGTESSRDSDFDSADADTEPERPFAVPLGKFIALEREQREPMLADADGRPVVGRHSLVLLGALGGHGKTTFFVNLSLHMAAGVDYPPFTVPRPVSILLIENEGPEQLFADKLAARLESFEHRLEARLDVCTFDWGGFSLADDVHRERLICEIAEKKYDLVFGDPLDSLGIEGVGSPADTRKFLELMKRTGLGKSVAWWLNTHPRKEETKEALNEIAGAWGGKPDSVFLLRMLDGDRTQIRQPKLRWARRGKGPTLLYAFDPDTEAFTYIGEQSEEERDYLSEIRELLKDKKWRIVKEIAAPTPAGIGANEKVVKKVLEEHPDVFESRTGDAAAALGRKATATVWQLLPRMDGEDDEPPEEQAASVEVGKPRKQPELDRLEETFAEVREELDRTYREGGAT